jgi:pimeloyl-ACP methyl ester carboxylesterase
VSTTARRLIYLHGFASSPGSNKARRFAEALGRRGLEIGVPDLNEGDFCGLTLSRQVRLLERMTVDQAPGSVVLVGSSMGGYAAALFTARSERVAALVLMAPAFGFIERWTGRMSAEALAEWRRRGAMQVLHYATNQLEPIGWSLVEDARQHPAYPEVGVPTLVIHGRHDESVPVECSERFAAGRPNVTLELLESDHSLGDVVDWIIDRVCRFLAPYFPQLEG